MPESQERLTHHDFTHSLWLGQPPLIPFFIALLYKDLFYAVITWIEDEGKAAVLVLGLRGSQPLHHVIMISIVVCGKFFPDFLPSIVQILALPRPPQLVRWFGRSRSGPQNNVDWNNGLDQSHLKEERVQAAGGQKLSPVSRAPSSSRAHTGQYFLENSKFESDKEVAKPKPTIPRRWLTGSVFKPKVELGLHWSVQRARVCVSVTPLKRSKGST